MVDTRIVTNARKVDAAEPTRELEELLSLETPRALQKFRESGQNPRLNPLVDPIKRKCLEVILNAEQKIEREKVDYVENRSLLQSLLDLTIGTGKEALFLELHIAKELLGDIVGARQAGALIDELHEAGLVDVKTIVNDSESGIGTMATMRTIVCVTSRGEVLLDIENQPALLVACSASN